MAAWTRDDDKAFETALTLILPFNDSDEDTKKWEELAAKVPGKSLEEVKAHYEALVEDIQAIEAGKVALPVYVGGEKEREREREKEREREGLQQHSGGGGEKKGGGFGGFEAGGGKSVSKAEQERRKGIPWTEEEHKLFLLGLDKFGKGDWRSISRNFVISRTPTQVASHAQKYFIRLNSMNRDRRRASIHDITSVNNGDVASPHVPITGQVNPAMAAPVKHHPHHPHHPHHHPAGMPAMGMYGPPAMGHPAAVGTPVMRPSGHPPYVIPVAYPFPPTMHP